MRRQNYISEISRNNKKIGIKPQGLQILELSEMCFEITMFPISRR
jgi:hypothetical protein